jgi:hypothetical protein
MNMPSESSASAPEDEVQDYIMQTKNDTRARTRDSGNALRRCQERLKNLLELSGKRAGQLLRLEHMVARSSNRS